MNPISIYQISTISAFYMFTKKINLIFQWVAFILVMQDLLYSDILYTAHKKFMNTSTSAEPVASFILEGRYREN